MTDPKSAIRDAITALIKGHFEGVDPFLRTLDEHRPWLLDRPDDAGELLHRLVSSAFAQAMLYDKSEEALNVFDAVLSCTADGQLPLLGQRRHLVGMLFELEGMEGFAPMPFADVIDRAIRTRPKIKDGINAALDDAIASEHFKGLNMSWVHIALARGWLDGPHAQTLTTTTFNTHFLRQPYEREYHDPAPLSQIWHVYFQGYKALEEAKNHVPRAMLELTNAGHDWSALDTDVAHKTRNVNPLHLAILGNHDELVRLLLQQGADPQAPMVAQIPGYRKSSQTTETHTPLDLVERPILEREDAEEKAKSASIATALRAAIARQAAHDCLSALNLGAPAP